MMPLSVIMPVRNHSEHLHLAIESILNQDFTDFEFLILDDGSIDSSAEIIKEFSIKDSRIKPFFNQTSQGVTNALNFLINKSCSSIIARQDADDISADKRFSIQLAEINNYELISSNFYSNNNDFSILIKKNDPNVLIFFKNLFFYYLGAHGQIVFKKRYYDKPYKFCQDYKLFSDILIADRHSIKVIQEPLYFYRKHKNSIYNYNRKKQILSSLKVSQYNIDKLLGLKLSLQTILDLRMFFNDSKLPKLPLPVFNFFLNKIIKEFKTRYCNEKEEIIIDNYIRETYQSVKNVF
jgi:glycosyltransferase involved in cell wall biosynthesis